MYYRYRIIFTFTVLHYVFFQHQIDLQYIRCPTAQSFTNAYLLIMYDKPIQTSETVHRRANTHFHQFHSYPLASQSWRSQLCKKYSKKSQSGTRLAQIRQIPTEIYSPMLLYPVTRLDHTYCTASQNLTTKTLKHLFMNHTINQLPCKSTRESFYIHRVGCEHCQKYYN